MSYDELVDKREKLLREVPNNLTKYALKYWDCLYNQFFSDKTNYDRVVSACEANKRLEVCVQNKDWINMLIFIIDSFENK